MVFRGFDRQRERLLAVDVLAGEHLTPAQFLYQCL